MHLWIYIYGFRHWARYGNAIFVTLVYTKFGGPDTWGWGRDSTLGDHTVGDPTLWDRTVGDPTLRDPTIGDLYIWGTVHLRVYHLMT